VNSPFVDLGPCLSADQLTLLFSTTGNALDLVACTRQSRTDAWSGPVSLGSIVNSHTIDRDPCLSADHRTLIFSSDRDGGQGKRDLWMSRRVRKPGVSAAARPVTAEWVSLFNGRDLTGWKTHPSQPGSWKVEEGQLVGFGAPSHLFSERGDYQDFHLRVEAQINDGGSSGVYFRVPEFAAPRYGQFPDGYEANINSTYATDTDRTGSLTGSLRGVAPFKNSLHKPDEWFTLQLLAQGQRILIQVNGQTTVDFVDANNTFRRGHLALQVWPAQSVVRFRKIEIKELISHEPGDAKNR